jgi:hypothetical protein
MVLLSILKEVRPFYSKGAALRGRMDSVCVAMPALKSVSGAEGGT